MKKTRLTEKQITFTLSQDVLSKKSEDYPQESFRGIYECAYRISDALGLFSIGLFPLQSSVNERDGQA